MHGLTKVWVTGGLAIAATATSTTLNAVVAFNTTSAVALIPGLRAILFVALGLSIASAVLLMYLTLVFVRNVKRESLESRSTTWTLLSAGTLFSGVALVVTGVSLIWLLVQQKNLPEKILQQLPLVWIGAWFGVWGVSLIAQTVFCVVLSRWTGETFKSHTASQVNLDFGIRLPPMDEVGVNVRRPSVVSRETTEVSPPGTPSSPPTGSARYSSSIKVAANHSKTKLVGKNSTRSSLDTTACPTDEAASIDNAFDRWDTSSVHYEMRVAVASSPPATRSGLETIPGSRPESPANALEEPFLPTSPRTRVSEIADIDDESFLPSSPHATSSDVALALDWSSPPRNKPALTTPPSSPPNFSRPTSKNNNKPFPGPLEPPSQELVHPLFRAGSPHPPPIATAGTMVTASPMANDPITPRTLARIRGRSLSRQTPKPTGHWRAMPSIDASTTRPSTAGSRPGSSGGLGSPGPSIADEEDLPPILPGFVLSAGTRSSLMGYAARKNMRKERRQSQRSSGILM